MSSVRFARTFDIMGMRVLLLIIGFCSIFATAASAQGNPEDFSRPGPDKQRQMYYAQVRTEINDLLGSWRRAWQRKDAAAIAALYGTEASLYAPGTALRTTRSAIRDFYADFLKTAGDVNVQMIEFGTSGDIAHVVGRLSYYTENPDGPTRHVVRTDMLVLRRRYGNDWLIQTHLAREEPEEDLANSVRN